MSSGYYLLLNNLNEQEIKIVKSIVNHINSDKSKVGISKIAEENFVSTSFIVKLSKKMGFEGYSELYYHLQKRGDAQPEEEQVLNYCTQAQINKFCSILAEYKQKNGFVIGAGFAEAIATYIVERLAVCGFAVFNRVLFYDYLMYKDDLCCEKNEKSIDSDKSTSPSYIIAISQSGETEPVLNDVEKAKKYNYKVISFTSKKDSTLANISDVCFLVNPEEQLLTRKVPNLFFAHVISLFELLLSEFVYGKFEKINIEKM